MAVEQQVFIVEYSPSWFGEEDKTRVVGGRENWTLSDGKGLNDLHGLLAEGWRVGDTAAMGGTGGGEARVLFRSYASVIVLERDA